MKCSRFWLLVAAGAFASAASIQSVPAQQTGSQAVQLECPDEPGGMTPGVYATAINKSITLSKSGQTLELGPTGARSGFASAEGLTCLASTPSLLTITPAPGGVGATSGCGAFIGSDVVALPTGAGALQSEFRGLDWLALNEIVYFVNIGYPAETVLLHAVSQGITVDRALYAAVNADASRADEFYRTTLELMPYLPGWTCSGSFDNAAYSTIYDVNDLSGERTVREVAQRYFKDRARMAPFPDWSAGEFNMLASVDELLEFAGPEFWYQAGPPQSIPGGHPRDAVLIALYTEGNRIVLDADRARLQALKQSGVQRVPVTFYYNFNDQIPISALGDGVKLMDVVQQFFASGRELTQVPLWQAGDYHLLATVDEILQNFPIPETASFDLDRYRNAVNELRIDGFSKSPVLITLLRSGDFKWVADPERVRAAIELGMQEVPVVLFYHRINRNECGAPTNCFNQINQALACAGTTAIAGSGLTPVLTGGSGGTVVEPPPPPPPPPLPPVPPPPGYTPPPVSP